MSKNDFQATVSKLVKNHIVGTPKPSGEYREPTLLMNPVDPVSDLREITRAMATEQLGEGGFVDWSKGGTHESVAGKIVFIASPRREKDQGFDRQFVDSIYFARDAKAIVLAVDAREPIWDTTSEAGHNIKSYLSEWELTSLEEGFPFSNPLDNRPLNNLSSFIISGPDYPLGAERIQFRNRTRVLSFDGNGNAIDPLPSLPSSPSTVNLSAFMEQSPQAASMMRDLGEAIDNNDVENAREIMKKHGF